MGRQDKMPCIVIIDDEGPILQLLHDLLDVEGFRAAGLAHADLVLPAVQRSQANPFLIDITPRTKSGLEVAQDLQSSHNLWLSLIQASASPTDDRAVMERVSPSCSRTSSPAEGAPGCSMPDCHKCG